MPEAAGCWLTLGLPLSLPEEGEGVAEGARAPVPWAVAEVDTEPVEEALVRALPLLLRVARMVTEVEASGVCVAAALAVGAALAELLPLALPPSTPAPLLGVGEPPVPDTLMLGVGGALAPAVLLLPVLPVTLPVAAALLPPVALPLAPLLLLVEREGLALRERGALALRLPRGLSLGPGVPVLNALTLGVAGAVGEAMEVGLGVGRALALVLGLPLGKREALALPLSLPPPRLGVCGALGLPAAALALAPLAGEALGGPVGEGVPPRALPVAPAGALADTLPVPAPPAVTETEGEARREALELRVGEGEPDALGGVVAEGGALADAAPALGVAAALPLPAAPEPAWPAEGVASAVGLSSAEALPALLPLGLPLSVPLALALGARLVLGLAEALAGPPEGDTRPLAVALALALAVPPPPPSAPAPLLPLGRAVAEGVAPRLTLLLGLRAGVRVVPL